MRLPDRVCTPLGSLVRMCTRLASPTVMPRRPQSASAARTMQEVFPSDYAQLTGGPMARQATTWPRSCKPRQDNTRSCSRYDDALSTGNAGQGCVNTASFLWHALPTLLAHGQASQNSRAWQPTQWCKAQGSRQTLPAAWPPHPHTQPKAQPIYTSIKSPCPCPP